MLLSFSFDFQFVKIKYWIRKKLSTELFYATFHFAPNLCWLHAISMNKKNIYNLRVLVKGFSFF